MSSFGATFKALTGHSPLRWQVRLFNELMKGRLPTALDIPTGLGKTSIIAIWLAARAAGAAVPRRLIYVVDRRAVVDQATGVADTIARIIGDGTLEVPPAVRKLRDGLRLGSGGGVPVSTLRGQHVDNRDWLEYPALSGIIVGTIDMIGSRLLFQGYGVSPRMRSVHAGLLGTDALIVLDEAHLVPPFEYLLRAIEALPRPEPIPPIRVLSLSATGRAKGTRTFRLTDQDQEDDATSARLRAKKRLKMEEARGDLADALARRAIELAGDSSRIIVYCDSRKVAQKVQERLRTLIRAQYGKEVPGPSLLVGGRRVRERSNVESDAVFASFRPRPSDVAPLPHPCFLVATSAGEVGVDLDADHLVMDLVPWERMVQRLGRVNRRSAPGESLVDVLIAAPEKDAESGWEKEAAELLAWRAPFESKIWRKDSHGRRDASPLSLMRLKDDAQFAELVNRATSPEPLYPELSKALVDAWAMTSLADHPGRPVVAPWLRGWVDDEPQTRVVWRQLFPVDTTDSTREQMPKSLTDRLRSFFAAAPPHLSETVDVPTSQAVDLIRRRLAALDNELERSGRSTSAVGAPSHPPLVVVLDASNDVERAWFIGELQRSDARYLQRLLAERTVVLDARFGGLAEEGLLSETSGLPPITLDSATADSANWAASVGYRVRKVPVSLDATDDMWRIHYRSSLGPPEDEGRHEMRVEVLRSMRSTVGDAAVARCEQGLSEHHEWTGAEARRLSRALQLATEYEKLLVAAARVHDAGKERELWQNAMRAPRERRPYAKTQAVGDYRALLVGGEGYRHEFGSVLDAESMPAIQRLAKEDRELALHLVAAHHGYARPAIAPIDPDAPPSMTLQRAQAIALRFYQMHERWGPWGLAWWETLLRAADWAASRAVNERGRNGK